VHIYVNVLLWVSFCVSWILLNISNNINSNIKNINNIATNYFFSTVKLRLVNKWHDDVLNLDLETKTEIGSEFQTVSA